ncbi:MAG: hypothetical protein CSB55_08240 [Candidatus Cloacimonadota bacterium]|nr:MAG: hypothetical protein CSB55_08240 [Candidatus Cloacimonadota bacterium]
MNNLSVNEVVEFALNIERNGKEFYEKALTRKDLSPQAKELLTKLRNEEIKHEAYFKTLGERQDLNEYMDPDGFSQTSSYLNSIVKAHIFNKPGAAVKLATEAKSMEEILKFAMQFEKDTLLYFHSLKEKTNNETAAKAVDAIIKEEIKHLEILGNYLDNL